MIDPDAQGEKHLTKTVVYLSLSAKSYLEPSSMFQGIGSIGNTDKVLVTDLGFCPETEDNLQYLLRLRWLFSIAAAVSFLAAYSDSNALSVKEQWLKDNAQSLIIRPELPPAILDVGGPDDFGYYFIDSDDDANNAPDFNWIDISGIGEDMGINADDQNVGPFELGFTFNYYGNDYTTFRACSNGWASFTSGSNAYGNQTIPTAGDPNDLLAVYWDDLHPRSGFAYYYTNDADTCVIAWHNFGRYSGDGDYTFEIIITADGNILYQYLSMTGVSDSHCIGIENSGGDIGLEYVFNTSRDETETSIYFGLQGPLYAEHDVRPTDFPGFNEIGRVGDSVSFNVRFLNSGIANESFPARLLINHNGQVYNQVEQVADLPPSESADAAFPPFTPVEDGIFELVAISELSSDELIGNDTLRTEFNAYTNIYLEDFELGNGFFTGDNDWEWGAPTSGPRSGHSGDNLWATKLAGSYSDGPLLSALISPGFGLTNNSVLTFWHWYNTESGFDGGNVKVSSDNGQSWGIITPADGYDGILSNSFQNPLGGEEAFYGSSGGWIQESFDLSDYSGSTILLKFDFGADLSERAPGWYIDDLVIIGGGMVGTGSIAGTVTDLATSNPLENAVVRSGFVFDTTDASGNYTLEVIPGIYSATASAAYHNPVTIENIEVFEGEIATRNFALPAPIIQIDTAPIDTVVLQGQTAEIVRNISNTGNGDLEFTVAISVGDRILSAAPEIIPGGIGHAKARSAEEMSSIDGEYAPDLKPGQPPTILDFGDELFTFDQQTPTQDISTLGVEFDGNNFWVTGRHPVDDIHKLYKFNRDGALLAGYDQGTFSAWGWRDLTWDGEYLYASDENEMAIIDPAAGQKIGTIPIPTSINPPLRGLAYDPATDHFWAANFRSNLIEFNRNGETISVCANNKSVYGLAWDNASEDGPWLWVFSQDGVPATQISQFNPRDGLYTGVVFYALDHDGGNDDMAGGACFTTEWDRSLGVFFGLVQGWIDGVSADLVQGYEITPYSQWLLVDPLEGILAPSANLDLTITIDFTIDSLNPDSVYQGNVIINNNSAATPVIPVTVSPSTGLDDQISDLPVQFALRQNYPNPFNPTTEIKFALPEQSDVTIDIFNLLGQKVTTLVDGLLPAGYHQVVWDGSAVASGIYYYKITAGGFTDVKKMTLLK